MPRITGNRTEKRNGPPRLGRRMRNMNPRAKAHYRKVSAPPQPIRQLSFYGLRGRFWGCKSKKLGISDQLFEVGVRIGGRSNLLWRNWRLVSANRGFQTSHRARNPRLVCCHRLKNYRTITLRENAVPPCWMLMM
jgi:hypothetical protein